MRKSILSTDVPAVFEVLEERILLSAGDIEWISQFGSLRTGGIGTTDLARAVDADGNVYVAGTTTGTLPGQTSAGGNDAFVRKYDVNGTELWTRQFGSFSADGISGISVDASGVYVAGAVGFNAALPGQTSAGNEDVFVRKYDANGTELWTRQFGSSASDQVFGISVDASGVYVAGRTRGTFPDQTSAGDIDAFVRKYDASGNHQWTRQFGSPSNDQAFGISVDASGVYVAGATTGTLTSQTSAGGTDAFVRKYDTSGNEVWTRQFGSSSDDVAWGISVDAWGVYVAGQTDGTLSSADGVAQTSAGGRDAFVRKYDTSGNEVWARQFGSSSTDAALGISVDDSGIYVSGDTRGTFPDQTSAGGTDSFVRKYDTSGNEIWTRQFGTSADDHAFGISVNASGVYVAGTTFGTFPGQTTGEGRDVFVRKYTLDGSGGTDGNGLVWTRQFSNISFAADHAFGISVDASGVYVAGLARRALPGQTRGGSSTGGSDAFVRKYDSNGIEIWTRQFGSSSFDLARGISVDASGVYVAGKVGFNAALPGQTSAGNEDAFVRKYDANGTELWTRQFGSFNNDQVFGISVDASGVYVAGTVGVNAFLPGQTSAGGTDAFVRKYTLDGTGGIDGNGLVWTRQFGSSAFDQASSISVDASGVYVAGTTTGTLPDQTSAGDGDAFVRKYTLDGSGGIDGNGLVWTRQFGTSSRDAALGISVHASAVYVAGLAGTLPGQTSAGGRDAFVRKYDTSGNEVWTRQFGSSSSDQGLGISVDASGVYVSGDTRGTLPAQTSAGGTDAFVRKYDTSGNEVWTRQFGSSSTDAALGISVHASAVYVAGDTSGTLPGQTSTGRVDSFVVKLSQNQPPVIAAQPFNLNENQTLVGTVVASDPDLPGDTLTFTITGAGADDALFSILATGELSFIAAPDFENPTDAGGTPGDNTYLVEVRVTDAAEENATATMTVTVNPVNDNAPAFTSGTAESVDENTTAVQTISATDDDLPAQTVIFSITGNGADDAKFQITGGNQLSFIAAPDFENPTDVGANNIYEVEITADDGNGLTTMQTVTVNVLNQASITGVVFVDVDQDGQYDANEPGIDGVAIELLDATDNSVLDTVFSSDGGFFLFEDLDPATYRLHEVQPTGVDDGAEVLGSLGGSIVANDTMQLTLNRTDASDYVFAELGQSVTSGDTATIGFWQNKHGQALIDAGGAGLANWLTTNFANVFGNVFDNTSVADFYKQELFKQKSAKSSGPAKVDAQFMATAMATYFTSSNLAGTVAAGYGFNVTDTGIGTKVVNVATSGDAFGVADGTDLTILQLLLATNALTDDPDDILGAAKIYDTNGDGVIDDSEAVLRAQANDLYTLINEGGDL